MIRVLIADDHLVVREGLKRIFAELSDIVVAGEAHKGQEVLTSAATEACDVVLLDMSLPDMHGLEVLKELKQTRPTLPVLVFSVHPEHQYAVRALKVGAAGYLTKDSESEELVAAIRQVAQGRRYISLSMGEQLAIEVTTDTPHPVHTTLSDREYQILLLLGVGKTVKEIAYDLSLSVKTVSTYRTRLLKKMHMTSNAELIHYVIHHQLLD